jgi:hypothetical protein
MKNFWICFVSLFVAVDAVAVLPMFLGLTFPMFPLVRLVRSDSLFTNALNLEKGSAGIKMN